MHSMLPPPPEDSRLAKWIEDGNRHEPPGSNIATVTSPDERYALTVELDEPVHGHLIRLWRLDKQDREDRIAQTIIEDRENVVTVAAEMVAAADDLAALDDDPSLGPDTIYREDVERGAVETPDEWDDEDEWEQALEDAYEKADILRSKGTLTTKTIDGREYYYLQWREGDKVRSQYIAPVSPAS
jgi:hypothetical protein